MNFADIKTLNETILQAKTYKEHHMGCQWDYHVAHTHSESLRQQDLDAEEILNSSQDFEDQNTTINTQNSNYGIAF